MNPDDCKPEGFPIGSTVIGLDPGTRYTVLTKPYKKYLAGGWWLAVKRQSDDTISLQTVTMLSLAPTRRILVLEGCSDRIDRVAREAGYQGVTVVSDTTCND